MKYYRFKYKSGNVYITKALGTSIHKIISRKIVSLNGLTIGSFIDISEAYELTKMTEITKEEAFLEVL